MGDSYYSFFGTHLESRANVLASFYSVKSPIQNNYFLKKCFDLYNISPENGAPNIYTVVFMYDRVNE